MKTFLIILSVIFCSSVNAWTINRDFNSGALGSRAVALDGFDHDANGSVYSPQSVDGTQSARLQIKNGTHGHGYWGGMIDFTKVKKGETLIFSADYYLPSSFLVKTNPGYMKWLRFTTYNAAGSKSGHLDVYMIQGGSGIAVIYEGQQKWFRSNQPIPRDKWFKVDVEFVIDDSLAHVTVKIDGKVIIDDSTIITLTDPNGYVNSFLLHTWYNKPYAPQDQHSYIDNIKISNQSTSAPAIIYRTGKETVPEKDCVTGENNKGRVPTRELAVGQILHKTSRSQIMKLQSGKCASVTVWSK